MKTFQGESRMLKPPSRAWLALSIGLLLAGLGFLAAFGYEQYQYQKSTRYYAGLQQVARGGAAAAAADTQGGETAGVLVLPLALRGKAAEGRRRRTAARRSGVPRAPQRCRRRVTRRSSRTASGPRPLPSRRSARSRPRTSPSPGSG